MLEFQEGFFEQEIRDGFYLDATMKTVWAAELEVLQKVAEVCDKYNLTWYAACGTLLGAIRHEGFVPWDDDMDIWMLRKDYNKLMEVLPKELPEHYRVRSPLTEEGYDQFHTCVNSGSGVSIAKDWLEEFHGCPFTVGLDIFPLDYLPRNEEEREMQKRLFLLAGRMAQQAKETDRGNLEVEDEEDVEDAVAKSKADILEGIQYLEENFNLKINKQLVEDEQWYEASSELWKWANYIAMMYGEEDGDYLAEYVDYTRWENKKFKKEWFDEVYSATFENFMLPIPAGYDEVLTTLYGDYMPYQRKTGQHEYPYYARQLRQLKEYVKDVQSRADKAGIANIEEMEVVEDTVEIPEEWFPIVTKKDGTRKKIVLSANDPAVYMAYGDEALDKLENALAQFEQAQEDVALWWRPMPVMEKLLHTVSASLAERYVSILDAYKNAGWGILDETDNADRAVANCDVYYGEMNAILQPFQNAGKAVIIAHMGDVDYKASNEARIDEYKAFINLTDFVDVGEKRYFVSPNTDGLLEANKGDMSDAKLIVFDRNGNDRDLTNYLCEERQGKICLLPMGKGQVHIYDAITGDKYSYTLAEGKESLLAYWKFFSSEGESYLLPSHNSQGLWRWDVENNTFQQETWWQLPEDGHHLRHGKIDDTSFYTLQAYSNRLYITDISNRTICEKELPDIDVIRIQYDGRRFWYVKQECLDIICWDMESEEIVWHLDADRISNVKGNEYSEIYWAIDKLFLVSGDGVNIYFVNEQCENIEPIYDLNLENLNYRKRDKVPLFKMKDELLIVTFRGVDEVILIDPVSLHIKRYSREAKVGKLDLTYCQKVLINGGALIYEDENILAIRDIIARGEKVE